MLVPVIPGGNALNNDFFFSFFESLAFTPGVKYFMQSAVNLGLQALYSWDIPFIGGQNVYPSVQRTTFNGQGTLTAFVPTDAVSCSLCLCLLLSSGLVCTLILYFPPLDCRLLPSSLLLLTSTLTRCCKPPM